VGSSAEVISWTRLLMALEYIYKRGRPRVFGMGIALRMNKHVSNPFFVSSVGLLRTRELTVRIRPIIFFMPHQVIWLSMQVPCESFQSRKVQTLTTTLIGRNVDSMCNSPYNNNGPENTFMSLPQIWDFGYPVQLVTLST
jgi:hypothetical protein